MPTTPGEWTVDGEDFFARVVAESGYVIAESHHVHSGDLAEAEEMHVANMTLIAAAKHLLAALTELLPKTYQEHDNECAAVVGSIHYDPAKCTGCAHSRARAAITRAGTP